ncbi:hypothetical protein GGR56DRAFT_651112 [Xylariaceae sp. FL0804]|nr:hypothetical protein GGR56DRAFT_651112 [Xylariaceae sp. FL0804]
MDLLGSSNSNPNPKLNPNQVDDDVPLVPPLVRADLNQLFFDRAYHLSPILQQAKFLAWAQCPWPSLSHACLQYAVWTVATAFSSQFIALQDDFYRRTRQSLAKLETRGDTVEQAFRLELTQALLLIATFELRQNEFGRAWANAGRAFRLVQLTKLHQTDGLGMMDTGIYWKLPREDECVLLEEKRRTFWFAYMLDIYLSSVNDLSVTFNEQAIYSRLPSAEVAFRVGDSSAAPFLSSLMEVDDASPVPTYQEMIIASTLWSRLMSHRQQLRFQKQQVGNISNVLWRQHAQLEANATQKAELLTATYPPANFQDDIVLLFSLLLIDTTLLLLYQMTEAISYSPVEGCDNWQKSREKATATSKRLVNRARSLLQKPPWQAPTFTPILLFHCASFFATGGRAPTFQAELRELLNILRSLGNVSLLAKSYSERLENDLSMGTCGTFTDELGIRHLSDV